MNIRTWLIVKLGGHAPSVACDLLERQYITNLVQTHITEHRRLMSSYRPAKKKGKRK